jgi:hypothetical protein
MTRRRANLGGRSKGSKTPSGASPTDRRATNVGKITNPEWPDPTEWINRLYQSLAKRQDDYDAETDIVVKRIKAAGVLGQVVRSLLELPPFRNESVHLPLKDLLIFLSDLDRGRAHPWAAPVNFGGTSATTTARSELKIWVRAAFAVLRANEFKPVEAYRRIAAGLTKSGRAGRGGEPVRWQLVQAWCREAETQHDRNVREKLEAWWVDFRSENFSNRPVDGLGKPIPEKEIAGRFADLCWSLQHLRDRSISVRSE